MLSKKTVRGFQRTLNWFYVIGISPYRWNREEDTVTVTKSLIRLLIVQFNLALYCLYGFNTALSYVERTWTSSFMDKSDQGVNFAWCCCFLGTAPTAWTNVRKRKEIVHYINSFFKMDRSLSRQHEGRSCPEGRDGVIEAFSVLALPWVIFYICVLFGMYIYDEDNPRYFYHRLGSYRYVCAMLEVYMYSQLYCALCISWGYYFTLFSWVKNYWLQKITSKTCETRGRPSFQLALRSYKLIQLLIGQHNGCFSRQAWPSFIACSISCHVFCIYNTVMVHKHLTIPALTLFGSWIILWVFVEVGVCTVVGRYEELSRRFQRSWLVQTECKLDRQKLRALKSLSARAGENFSIHRSSALEVVLVVSELTVHAILIL